MLFTGSMRSNLDPFARHSDDECWEALKRSHLAKMVQVSTPLVMLQGQHVACASLHELVL